MEVEQGLRHSILIGRLERLGGEWSIGLEGSVLTSILHGITTYAIRGKF